MGTLKAIVILGLGLLVVAGCYYYEEDYYRDSGRYGYGYGAGPYARPGYPAVPAPVQEGEPLAPEPEGFEAPIPPAVQDEGRLVEAGIVEADYDVHVRLIGVSPEDKDGLESEIRGLEGVSSVAPLEYNAGELRLGLKFDGSLRSLKGALDEVCRFRVRRFLIELGGDVDAAPGFSVRIFAPADGSRLTQRDIYVGVEVEGTVGAAVTVNGIPAEPFSAQGKYKARIRCVPGPNRIIAVATDASGRSARAETTVFVTENEAVEDTNLTVLIQGKVEDALSTVTVDGHPVKVNPDGTYRVEVTLKEGQEFVIVVAVDSLGNKKIRKIRVAGN